MASCTYAVKVLAKLMRIDSSNHKQFRVQANRSKTVSSVSEWNALELVPSILSEIVFLNIYATTWGVDGRTKNRRVTVWRHYLWIEQSLAIFIHYHLFALVFLEKRFNLLSEKLKIRFLINKLSWNYFKYSSRQLECVPNALSPVTVKRFQF